MQKKILITGGLGYIGSHTVVELQNTGYDVIIVDDLSNSDILVLGQIEKITGKSPDFYKIDISDFSALESIFIENEGIDAIIHFAAAKAVGESVENPIKYYQNNLVSLLNLIECQKRFKVHNMVFSSSCTVYGQPDSLPVTEDTPRKDAESPYGNTKRIGEDIIRDCVTAYGNLKSVALRYFNPIGAHESGLIGELPIGVPQNLVPYISQTAAGIRDQLLVFGDDYNTPDGSAIRDFINVVDLAKAHVIALVRLLENRNKQSFEVFNLGTGKGHSVLELIQTFQEVTGVNVNYKITSRRAGDIEKIWADTKYAHNELGWKAEKSIHETLLSVWDWQNNLGKVL